jgi:uncharacterized protein
VNKIVTIILVTMLVVYLFRRFAQNRGDARIKPPSETRKKTVEDMVKCKVCGVNLPRSEAILSRGRIYCCDEHRQADT